MRILVLLAPLLLVSSCGNHEAAPAATGARATVTMRDGARFTGEVVASSPRQLVMAEQPGVTRTLDMKQVRSVVYDEPQPDLAHQPESGAASPPRALAEPTPRPAPVESSPRMARREPLPVAPEPLHERHVHPVESQIRTKTYMLPVDTQVAIRTEETIDSRRASEGQTFAAEVARDLVDANGDLVIPKGANAVIVIKSASQGGRFKGQSDLVLDLKSVAVEGRQYTIDTADITEKGRQGVGVNKRTAEFGGGGAAIGAIIGAIAGGGKGAGIGAGAGAGAGVLGEILTKGGSINVPAESILTFRLDRPFRVVAAR